MAKKPVKKEVIIPIGIEKVFSNKYQCLLTKSTSYFDEATQDWLNVKIEENFKMRGK